MDGDLVILGIALFCLVFGIFMFVIFIKRIDSIDKNYYDIYYHEKRKDWFEWMVIRFIFLLKFH